MEIFVNHVVLYGLPTCDTCRKARNWLKRFDVEHRFVDYRAEPVPAATLKDWAYQLGGWEKLVNKSSTTWRNLLPQRKDPRSDPEWTLLLKEYPALIRRPVVVQADGNVSVGFSDNGFKKLFGP
jgi:Spx/MgsR family transcriptional regulator